MAQRWRCCHFWQQEFGCQRHNNHFPPSTHGKSNFSSFTPRKQVRSEERPHALRPLNPSFSTIVDRCWWSSITIVNRGSLPQIVLFNDHGLFKPNNDHDRKLQNRRSRIVQTQKRSRSQTAKTSITNRCCRQRS